MGQNALAVENLRKSLAVLHHACNKATLQEVFGRMVLSNYSIVSCLYECTLKIFLTFLDPKYVGLQLGTKELLLRFLLLVLKG